MKSLNLYIMESAIERYSAKLKLADFFRLYLKWQKISKADAQENIISLLNKYSDGGPNKDDWFTSNQSKEIKFTTYIENISGNERYVIEIQDPRYDVMKIAFEKTKDKQIGRYLYNYIKNKGNKSCI